MGKETEAGNNSPQFIGRSNMNGVEVKDCEVLVGDVKRKQNGLGPSSLNGLKETVKNVG